MACIGAARPICGPAVTSRAFRRRSADSFPNQSEPAPTGLATKPSSAAVPHPASMPAPESALHVVDEPRSASAIVGGELVGHHILHIDGYSRIKDKLPTGKSIQSRPFSAGGRRWSILYYPNGQTSEEADFVSVFLQLTKSADGPVKARATFDLLDGAGNPLPLKSRTLDLFEFSPGGSSYGFPKFIKKEFLEKSEHLLNDCFKISCDIIIPEELRTEDRIVSLLDAVPPPDLNQHLGDLLMSKEGADVTFQVAGESFCAHRCLLAARSRVFKAELWGAMKESTATGDCIRIDDMLPQVFKALLHFIYTDSLPQMEEQEEAVTAQHLLEAADRYDMQRLKLICEEKLYRHLDVSTAATTLVLAEQHCCRGLKQACIEFLKFPDSLEAIMETDGFEHLTKSCPALVKELMSELYLFKQCKRRKLKT